MRDWMKEWGQYIFMLAALGGFYGFIRADMTGTEDRLTARIEGVAAAVAENGKAIARLEGFVRGLHRLDLAEEDR